MKEVLKIAEIDWNDKQNIYIFADTDAEKL